MFESQNVCTRKRELEVIELPRLSSWAVKKRRTASCSAQFIKSVNPLSSTIAGAYPQLLTYLQPCSFPCHTGIQNSDKDSAIIYTDAIEGPITPPQAQPNIKKRKVDFLIDIPVYIIPTADSISREIFPQLPRVGNCDSSEFKNQVSEIVCDSENVNGNQELLVNVSLNTELFEPNSDWHKTFTNLIDENADSACTNHDAILDISLQASDIDICNREMSQPLICVGISQTSELPVQGTEMICYEKLNGDQHPAVNVSSKTQLFESNDDCCKTFGRLNNENVDPASINEDRLHISSSSIASHRKAGSKNLGTITDLLTPSAWQNNIPNQLLAGNVVPNLCMHERAGHSKEKQINLLSPELSSMAASPTLGDNDALQEQTLQSRSGLLAAEQEHDHEVDLNKVPTQKPKKRKHRPKILKDVSFVKKSRLKIQYNSTASELPKGVNFKGNQCQAKTPIFNKEGLNNSCLRKSDSSHSVTDVNTITKGEMLDSSELIRFQSDVCQNDSVFVQNKCNNKELISRVAYEQVKLIPVTFGNHVRNVDEGFSKKISSAISQEKKKAKSKILDRRKKKAEIKDLVGKKQHTISKKHIENEEYASALTMQIVSMDPLVKFKGKRPPRKKLFMDTLDAVQERLKNLTFDEDQVYSTRLHDRQEMIPLGRKVDLIPSAECLALIPYEDSFETLKIKEFRPNVLLNSEAKRDFNLLIGKGGVENETYDDEKEKLNQERNIFKNRAESFIACMRVLQGNRQFSPWKGSVVDSVVGAFLTQNVSDHVSSSAFISLASQYPHVENTKFRGEPAPSDLGLSIELPQNPGSSLPDEGCESTFLQKHITVPDISVASIENLQAENETRNVKFRREMTPEEVSLTVKVSKFKFYELLEEGTLRINMKEVRCGHNWQVGQHSTEVFLKAFQEFQKEFNEKTSKEGSSSEGPDMLSKTDFTNEEISTAETLLIMKNLVHGSTESANMEQETVHNTYM